VDKPKTDDALYLYRVGHAAAFPTAVEARRAAYHDALQQVAEWLRREANLTPDTPVRIHGVAIEPGCVYTEPQQTGFASWVQISYPTSSKTNAIDRPK
jgi:lysophospholipase L1-like esterase